MAATPPANDLLVNATVVASTPFTDVIDTTGATTDADDGPATSLCPTGGMTNSVWYVYTNTTAAPRQLTVDTAGTNYAVAEVIDVGAPTPPFSGQCSEDFSPGGVAVSNVVGPGATAWIVISSVSGAGGQLAVAIDSFPSPSNDTIGEATRISALPFGDVTGTVLATTDADDVQAGGGCGQPTISHSVWYAFTAGPSDTTVLFDATASSYLPGIIIATGVPGAVTPIACDGGTALAVVPTIPGTTYYALIYDSSGNGGRLDVTVAPTPPPPTIHVWFGDEGTVNPLGGAAHVVGIYDCSSAGLASIFGRATQQRRSGFVDAEGLTCDGARHTFSATATPDEANRWFIPGKLTVEFNVVACNILGCTVTATESQVIKLKPAVNERP